MYCAGRAEAELKGPGAAALDRSAVMSTSTQMVRILEKAIVLAEKAVTMFPCLNNQSIQTLNCCSPEAKSKFQSH